MLGFDRFQLDGDFFAGRHVSSQIDITKRPTPNFPPKAVFFANPKLHCGVPVVFFFFLPLFPLASHRLFLLSVVVVANEGTDEVGYGFCWCVCVYTSRGVGRAVPAVADVLLQPYFDGRVDTTKTFLFVTKSDNAPKTAANQFSVLVFAGHDGALPRCAALPLETLPAIGRK